MVAFKLRRIRGEGVALVVLGVLVWLWGFIYGRGLGWLGYVPYFSSRYQVGQTVSAVGFFLVALGAFRLFRRKGDYDDLGEPPKGASDGGSLDDFYEAARKLDQEKRDKEL